MELLRDVVVREHDCLLGHGLPPGERDLVSRFTSEGDYAHVEIHVCRHLTYAETNGQCM
jgi:hypothetical protein